MLSMRLLNKVAPLAITLFVFIFGTQSAFSQVQTTWTGASSGTWSDATNWTNGVAGSLDEATFTGAGIAPVIPATGIAVDAIVVTGTQIFDLQGALTTNDLTINAGYSLTLNKTGGGLLNMNGDCKLLATFVAGSSLEGSGSVPVTVNIGSAGKVWMEGVTTVGTSFGENIQTNLTMPANPNKHAPNPNFVQSDLCFYGNLHINYNDVELGPYNLYMGPNPLGQITGYNMDAADKSAAGSIVTLNENYAYHDPNNTSGPDIGRLCKGYDNSQAALDSDFMFPLRTMAYEGMALLMMRVVSSCTDVANISTTEVPFANIQARTVFNSTGQGGHPGAESSTPTVWHHWPIISAGMPEEYVDVNNVYYEGTGIAGYVEFHNNYRNGGTSLFSAIYKDNLEEQNPLSDDPLTAGTWDLRGSILTTTTTGNKRLVPFGPYYDQTADCMQGFGDIGVGTNSGGNIPVELTSFSAHYMDGSVRLSWQTATELNNNGFYVERAIDGEGYMWEEIGFVQGAGNSNVPLDYRYEDVLDADMQHLPKIAYRLRQVDRDGTTDYSNIVYAYSDVRPLTVEMYEAYPNPFNPSTTLSFSLQETVHATLKVYNTFGQEVATVMNKTLDAGYHTVEFRGSELPSGVYIAVLEAAGSVQQQKLVLNK